ncbi:MAG: transglutaminase domain-containing protein [Candidatus Aenigmarchaeota archaeon]|nr:transglutaminase domain-containing protein [Candidatus Aenigmarchaeota archaeon]
MKKKYVKNLKKAKNIIFIFVIIFLIFIWYFNGYFSSDQYYENKTHLNKNETIKENFSITTSLPIKTTSTTTAIVKKGSKKIEAYFCDDNGNCLKRGKISLNKNFTDDFENEKYILSYDIFSLFSKDSGNDFCLTGNFNICWNLTEEDFDYEKIEFQMGFPYWDYITPTEVEKYLEKIGFESGTRDELDKIKHYLETNIRYRFDSIMGTDWDKPANTLDKGYGDCEDWATTFVSLAKAYNRSIKCYVVLFENHAGSLCKVDNTVIIYDDQIEVQRTILDTRTVSENKSELRKLIYSYLDYFDISNKDIYAAFSENFCNYFDSNEDFYNWLLYL